MIKNKKIGLALSGGGYRAAAFHIGTLRKMNELGILKNLDVLSTISGGSITGAAYCLHDGDFKSFELKMIKTLTTKSVIKYVLGSWIFLRAVVPSIILFLAALILPFTKLAPLSIFPLMILGALLVKYQFKLLPISKIIEKAYNDFFFNEATLSKLCEQPEIAIGSTNLQTQRHFTFSRRKMEDSVYAYYQPPIFFNGENFPVARAVMASTCVPFAFTPVDIADCYFRDSSQAQKIKPKLVDGGVYDNQGIHKLTYDGSSYACEIVVVSDAGSVLPFEKLYNNTFTLLLRTIDTFMARIKNFQMMQNIYQKPNKREIAYISLGWDLESCLPGFITNLISGNIAPNVVAEHKFQSAWLEAPGRYRNEITEHLEKNCQIKEILERKLEIDRVKKIRSIRTNLTRLDKSVVEDMTLHAANLTELQIRLYCPSLLSNPQKI